MTSGTCSPTYLMIARIQTPTPTATVTWHRKKHLLADQPEPGAKLIIWHPKRRISRRRSRVTMRLNLAGAMELDEEHPNGNSEGELHGDQLVVAEQVTASRPVGAIQWVTSLSESLRATTSCAQSRRQLECQRHLRRNAQNRVVKTPTYRRFDVA